MGNPQGLAITPVYCPPELAAALASGSQELRVSRKMDIWAAGMSILDCILPKPLLQAHYASDTDGFWPLLAGHMSEVPNALWSPRVTMPGVGPGEDYASLLLPPEVFSFDRQLGELLSQRLLRRQPMDRSSILE